MDKGAHYHRCDFQVHSPRDRNWIGVRPSTEAERLEYASELVAASRAKSVRGIAITDHHDFAFFPYVRRAAQQETDEQGNPLPADERLTVFPGLELTLAVPCQALLILDADFPDNLLPSVLTALGVDPAPSAEPRTAETRRLEHISSFERLYETLQQQAQLRGRFIVLPNVSETGTSTLLRSGFAAAYKQMPCVGGYVDGSITQHGMGNTRIVAGKNKDYGNKALGLFQTSDNRQRDHSKLGTHSTWVKWATSSAEALRQACLARDSRLSQVEPTHPSICITRIHVSNSQFLGPINLELNPQYNCLIGSRGTGKSTILEYLRWGLCDEPDPESADILSTVHSKRLSLVQQTLLPGSVVEISFLINNIPHTVRRKSPGGELMLKIGDEEFKPCTQEEVHDLLPLQAYSQKQLSGVGVRLEELTRFVRTPVQRELAVLSDELVALLSRLRSTYEAVRRERALIAELSRDELETRSLAQQLESLRINLKGLSAADLKLIQDQSLHDMEGNQIRIWEAELAKTRDGIEALQLLIETLPTELPEGTTPHQSILLAMNNELRGQFAQARASLRTMAAGLDSTTSGGLGGYGSELANWRTLHDKSRAAYNEAKRRSTAHQSVLDEIERVEGRMRVLESAAVAKRTELNELKDPQVLFRQHREELGQIRQRRAELLARQCESLTVRSQNLIRARLLAGHDSIALDEQLRTILRGSKIRGERFEALWSGVRSSPDPHAEWNKALDELEQLAMTGSAGGSTGLPATPLLDKLEFTARERLAIATSLRPEAWIGLLTTELGDIPYFEYQSRAQDYIPFKDASAGQQATALMFSLLNQTGPPLVIDQPEDDLDNKVIGQVIENIWKAKSHRQLIFTSHNANLVVNGDAELVVCCEYRIAGDQSGGQIKLEGAIDMPSINTEITNVIEGGRDAFTLRRDKYGF